jgi:hypothetical protein
MLLRRLPSMRKAEITINGRTYKGNCVGPDTGARIHNQYYKKYFPLDSHSLKCNDTFTVRDERIKFISFFGSVPVFMVMSDGTKQYHEDTPIEARYCLEPFTTGEVVNSVLF